MEEKKLSDFNLEHIIYMSVGYHFEELDEIIKRKNDEIEQKHFTESLWAFNSGIAETVFKLCNAQFGENDSIYCLMTESGKEIKTKYEKKARYYENIDGKIIEIPAGMNVTFARNGAYALMVEKYYKIVEDDIFYTNEYDYENKNKYIRGFGLLNKKDRESIKSNYNTKKSLSKKISYIAKLKKPFLVKIFESKPE